LLSLALTEGAFEFDAGQYLEVLHPDGTAIPLSIASPPEQLPALTLHYRSTPGLPEAARMDELLTGNRLDLRGGFGDVRLATHDRRPLFLIAGGTGISQALCLAAAQCHRHSRTRVELLGCADAEADLYFADLLPTADAFHAKLIADPRRDAANSGLAWLAGNAQRIEPEARIVISGSPAFVFAVTDTLTALSLPESRLESDVYAWAPR